MSQVFKIVHTGAEPPKKVRIGVRVRDESTRDTLEVPVVYRWPRPGATQLAENRTYTFSRFTETKSGPGGRLRERYTRFLECPADVAELLASVEFQGTDPEKRIVRGYWLDVRMAANQDEYDKADSLEPSVAMKAETAPEPPGLLREKKVVRTGKPPAPKQDKPKRTGKPSDDDIVVEDRPADRAAALDKKTKAELSSYAEKVLKLELKGDPTKAQIIDQILQAEGAAGGN